ncbi:MAG: NUMOD3 domain-containing DNA-binding protein [Microbacterium sp.]|uniref:NUMOD3 domain-containing DNA-binding protein n=1 Tax=Microbacterium sp. TaxID=51671 RepID=UPI003F9B1445
MSGAAEKKMQRGASWPFVGVIYGVREIDSEDFRYVGLTTATIPRRRAQHWKAVQHNRRTPFVDWLGTHDDHESVYFQSLELVMSEDLSDLGAAERTWITRLRSDGHALLNLTEGGLGPRGYVWTEEQRRAAGDRSRGRKRTDSLRGDKNPMWGRSHSDEQKARWSRERKGSNSGDENPNFGKFGSDHPSYGHTMSEESKARLAEMRLGERNPNFGKTASAETRAKMSAVRKGRPMPSSVRSAHTRHHTNKNVFKETCRHCIDDAQKTTETRKDA